MKDIILVDNDEQGILGERCEEIDIRKENNLQREITVELKDTIRQHKDCVGLAANQIGYNKRIFVINFNGDLRTFINPIISNVKGFTLSRESCMSLPGKQFIRPRNTDITVVYQTPLGKTESRRLVGLAAEVFQHELDHLDGLTLADVGLELEEGFDELSEEDKNKILDMYLDSLDIKKKEVDKEIEENPELKQLSEATKFMEAVQQGKVEFGDQVTATKPKDDEDK